MPTSASRGTRRSPRRATRAAAARRPAAAPSSPRRSRDAAAPARGGRAPIRFRRAGPGDVAAIVRQMRALYRHDGLRFEPAVARRALTGLLRARRFGGVFVLDAGGRIAGYGVLTLSWSLEYAGADAFVDELYVAPAWRGRGLGRLLVEFLATRARARGVNALHLQVGRANRRARALYSRTGFVDDGRLLLTRRLAPRR